MWTIVNDSQTITWTVINVQYSVQYVFDGYWADGYVTDYSE